MSGQGGYAAVPNWFVDDTSFSFQAKLVYMVFARHVDKYGAAFPGVKHIAEKAGISESAVKRAKKELERAGLLELVEQRRYGGPKSAPQSTVYKVLTSLPAPATSGQVDPRSKLSTGQGELRSVGAEVRETSDLGSEGPLNKPQVNNPRVTTRGVPVDDVSPSVVGGEKVRTSPAPVENFAPRGPLPRPDRCAAHQHVAVPGKCGDCADARKTLALVEADVAARPLPKCKHGISGGCRFDEGRDLAYLDEVS